MSSSLRAQRRNPASRAAKTLDCFVATLLAMTAEAVTGEETLKDQE
jgi:hypothetical protein